MRYCIKVFTAAIIFLVLISGAAVAVYAQSPDVTPPSVPMGLTATAHQPSTIQLSWSASTDNVGVAGYNIYRNGTLVASIPGTSYLDTGLGPGGYTYMITAYDAAGNVSLQSPAATAFLALDNTPPTKPGNLSVAPASTSTVSTVQINITWGASTDDTSVVGYYVYRNNVLLTTSTIYSATSYTDTVPPGTYQYAVSAYDTANLFSDRATAPAVTIVADTIPPNAPLSLSAAVVSASGVRLVWLATYDNIGVVGYYVYRNGGQIANVNITSFTDSGLTPNTYTYSVAAYDGAGNISQPAYTSITLLPGGAPPSVPTGVTASLTPAGVNISWLPPINFTFLSGYYVYRGGTQIANVTSTSYLDTGVASGTLAYTVAAYDNSGNVSGQSLPANISFNSLPTAIPTTPSSVSSPSISAGSPGASTGVSASIGAPALATGPFTSAMYYGLRSNQVKTLQLFLVQKGYLAQSSATGFYGTLTQKALRKFQCDHNIVCSGSPSTTGWGSVGARTRAVLNGLYGGTSSTDQQTQSFQAQLLNLQAQLQALQHQAKQ